MKRGELLLGIVQVARGKPAGVMKFPNTREAVLTGLAPLAAILMVAGALAVFSGGPRRAALADLLAVVVALAGPLVLSHDVARRWGRANEWFRFAAAFCWCQWAAPVAFLVMLIGTALLIIAGVPDQVAAGIGVAAMMGYGLWLHWFLAKHALEISGRRALGLVLLVSFATFVLISLPAIGASLIAG